jgi:hypothetical protein
MNIREYNHLRSEQTALKRMLAGIPDENVLDRSGLQARLEEVGEQLGAAGEVGRAFERLRKNNFREQETTLHGEFQGVLPKARRFEFQLSANGEVVRGKIGQAIADPDFINQYLHRPATITVTATRVGNGKPRYMLLALPSWD